MLRGAAVVIACLVLGAAAAAAAEVVAAVHWSDAILSLEVSRPLDAAEPSTVRAKEAARQELESRLPALLIDALGPVIVDSSRTAAELLRDDARFFDHVTALARGAVAESATLSADLAVFTERWAIPLFGPRGIVAPLLPPRSSPLRAVLGRIASRPFSGLIIWAKGELALAGTSASAPLEPALFPRIWDEQMDLVLEKANCRPQSLAAWGMVGYATDLDDPAVARRAGSDPLRVAARGVFGTHPVDVVIPLEAARQLLSVPENVQALAEGRVVIIWGK